MSRQTYGNIVTPEGKFTWSFECEDPERMTQRDRESILAHIVVALRLDDDPSITEKVERV